MTWIAPNVERVEPAWVAGERAMLEAFLDHHRQTLLWKCSGLTAEQLARPNVDPSPMSLLGILRHMSDVERGWFRRGVAGQEVAPIHHTEQDPDADFDTTGADAEADYATYLAECAAARRAVAGRGLDDTFHSRHGHNVSLRWVYLHMIEEYARHNGHADLLRERIDGATGE